MKLQTERGTSLLEILFVAAITVTIAAIALPIGGNAIGFFRLSGDARKVSNAVAVSKMRAASEFTQSRLYVDLNARQFHMETYRKTGTPGWVWQGGATTLSQGVTFGYGSISSPPLNTQPALGQAPACLADDGTAIGNTACIVFNSRGIPVVCTTINPAAVPAVGCAPADPETRDALYLTDGTAVYGITMLATGMMQVWRTPPSTTAWTKQ